MCESHPTLNLVWRPRFWSRKRPGDVFILEFTCGRDSVVDDGIVNPLQTKYMAISQGHRNSRTCRTEENELKEEPAVARKTLKILIYLAF